MRRAALVLALVATSVVALAEEPGPSKRPRPFLRGVVLSLHDEDTDRDYGPEIAEIDSRLGASHVSIAFHLWVTHADSKAPERGDKTPSDDSLRRVLRQARERGLETMLIPIVLIDDPKPGEWRGKLTPPDARAWLEAYEKLIVEYAKLASEEKVALFSIGSELSWCEEDGLWRRIIKDVRAVFSGQLLYSANWDHYAQVPFWDALDAVGLSGYYDLAKEPGQPIASLKAGWDAHKDAILGWKSKVASTKPLLFTEVGYPSRKTAAVKPWHYTSDAEADPEEQRRCYEAFVLSWQRVDALEGAFFYEWWGEGGLDDAGYTPRDKPAEGVLRRFFADLRVVEKRR